MNINTSKVARLCIIWAFLLLLGIEPGWNAPFVLAVVGTALDLLT